MANVPHVALCYHRAGVVQGYQVVSTQKLPRLAGLPGFDPQLPCTPPPSPPADRRPPQVVEEYAGSVLNWLKERCTGEDGSPLLALVASHLNGSKAKQSCKAVAAVSHFQAGIHRAQKNSFVAAVRLICEIYSKSADFGCFLCLQRPKIFAPSFPIAAGPQGRTS